MKKEMQIVGINCLVKIESYEKIPAKIDTGADSSAIWVSNLSLDEETGELSFSLFDEESPYYDGKKIKTNIYRFANVKSSMYQAELRFKVQLNVVIKGRKIRAWFNLSNRSKNKFPILIGRRTLNGSFLVDCSINNFKKLTQPEKVNPNKEEIRSIINRFNNKSNNETTKG